MEQEALHSGSVMLSEAIEVYRSARRVDCDVRAFMLTAVGVPNELVRDGRYFLLRVDPLWAEQANEHLRRYQEELRSVPPAPPRAPLHLYPHAWLGSLLYGVVLLAVAEAVSSGFGRLDAFEVGELDAGRVQHGQWWRALTALTLHLDPAHLLTNIGAGVWFGYLAGRLLGPGVAWALIVLGAGAANLLEAALAVPEHVSVGASTAVFTALGLLAVTSWRTRRASARHWALGLSPLVAGVVLLGWLGTSGEHTDIMAHLAGFAVGGALAALAVQYSPQRLLARVPQWAAGAVALLTLAMAWACALRS